MKKGDFVVESLVGWEGTSVRVMSYLFNSKGKIRMGGMKYISPVYSSILLKIEDDKLYRRQLEKKSWISKLIQYIKTI